MVDLVSMRMEKKEVEAANGGGRSGPLERSQIRFFVYIMSKGSKIEMEAYPEDNVKSLHERIQSMMGIPLLEQTLTYRRKQLHWQQTLTECFIQNEANLLLVGRMLRTKHPRACQVINDMVYVIYHLCHKTIVSSSVRVMKGLLIEYLNTAFILDKDPKLDTSSAFEYFQIFLNFCAPNMFVALYVSSYPGIKECADFCIRLFFNFCCDILSNKMRAQCVRVVLKFCNVLRKEISHDPLYLVCLSTLEVLLETVTFSYVSYETENVEGLILIQDISRYVRELANSMLSDLDLSMESHSPFGNLLNDVRHFTAFLMPFRRGVEDHQATILDSITAQKRQIDTLLTEEILYLHLLYNELLNKIDQCFQKMEQRLANPKMVHGDKDDNSCHVCSQYLSILKELYQISKVYDGAEEKLWCVLTRQKSVLCKIIIRYANRKDEHHWILKNKSVTNFESRRHLSLMMFPEIKVYDDLEMPIDRSQLLADSFEYFARADPASLHAVMFVEFENEEATGPGVLREWFLLVCKEIFHPQNALFVACPNDRGRYFPNPASKVHPMHLEYFRFSGQVIALALMHRVQVGIVFDRVFYFQLAGKCITLEDIKYADPFLYTSCKQILEMDSEFIDSDALGLTFSREVDELGHRKVVELCPSGENILVNSKNREKYVHLLIQDCFVTSISEQVSHFAKGFADILSNSKLQKFFFQSLELEDLDWMLFGSRDTISIEDWKVHTLYKGYEETDIQISWFWEIVVGMTAEERKGILLFWTSLKYLPVEGFSGLDSCLTIEKSHEHDDRLPTSHTCFYQLIFPAYSSMAVMKTRLKVIAQEYIAYSFGTL